MNFIRILALAASCAGLGILAYRTMIWWRVEKERLAELRRVGKQIDLRQMEIVNGIILTREEREELARLYDIEKELHAQKKGIFG